MRLATIEGGSELDADALEYLADQIRAIPVHTQAQDLIETLAEMDRELLLEKLISDFIEHESQSVGSQIGFDQKKVDEMLESYESEQKATRNNNRRKKRR